MSEVKDLTAEDILQSQDMHIQTVDVPEWNGRVYVRTLTGTELSEYNSSLVTFQRDGHGKMRTEPNMKDSDIRLVSMACCNREGKRLFTNDQVKNLRLKNGAAIERICKVARKLNLLDEESFEDAQKN